MKKNNKGITLMALAITIVLSLILAGVATYSGTEVIQSAKQKNFYSELKILQTNVNNWYEELKPANISSEDYENQFNKNIIDKFNNAGVNIEVATSGIEAINDEDYQNYYILEKEDLKKLHVDGVEQKVLINIKKRKVVSYNGFTKSDGQKVYSLEEGNEVYNVKYEPDNL